MCFFVISEGPCVAESEGWCTAVTRPLSGWEDDCMTFDSQAQTEVVVMVMVVMVMVVMIMVVVVVVEVVGM